MQQEICLQVLQQQQQRRIVMHQLRHPEAGLYKSLLDQVTHDLFFFKITTILQNSVSQGHDKPIHPAH